MKSTGERKEITEGEVREASWTSMTGAERSRPRGKRGCRRGDHGNVRSDACRELLLGQLGTCLALLSSGKLYVLATSQMLVTSHRAQFF